MAFSLSKLFKPKPTVDASELLNQINYTEGTKFAECATHVLYADVEELGGFPYLKTTLFGIDEINIRRVGCSISYIFQNETLTFTSDNTTIESHQIQRSGIYFTPVDFELTDEEASKIKTNKLVEIEFKYKKNTIHLKPI
ncbi:hypothetical protein ACFQ5N_01660 [Lutibacter holmesii]|uniref:Uncharacterized protein n=1 Tax=Lutibacter holmesii TaxID=1137985 RepID=A0ABW3WLB7_9FLAO